LRFSIFHETSAPANATAPVRSTIATPIPGLSFLPILGYLFRSQRYVNNETELVFICTAHVVKPVSPEQLPPLPGQQGAELQGLEGFFGHRAPTVRKEEKREK
jgi:Flp pilus assembly secretin CpaC